MQIYQNVVYDSIIKMKNSEIQNNVYWVIVSQKINPLITLVGDMGMGGKKNSVKCLVWSHHNNTALVKTNIPVWYFFSHDKYLKFQFIILQ